VWLTIDSWNKHCTKHFDYLIIKDWENWRKFELLFAKQKGYKNLAVQLMGYMPS
jgi:hypothetical protein